MAQWAQLPSIENVLALLKSLHPLQPHQCHMETGNSMMKMTQVCGPPAKLQRTPPVTYNKMSHSSHHFGCGLSVAQNSPFLIVLLWKSPFQWPGIPTGMPPTLKGKEAIVTWQQVAKEGEGT